MYKGGRLTICDRLTQIKESIYYIQQWSKEINCADDFLASMDKVMVLIVFTTIKNDLIELDKVITVLLNKYL